MEVRISDISKSQRDDFLHQSNEILKKTEGPLRLNCVVDKKSHQQVLFLRERTWSEFFLEKLILTPQEMEDVENEALAALELTFLSLDHDAECGDRKSKGKGGRESLVRPEKAQLRSQPSNQAYIDNDNDNGGDNDRKIGWNAGAKRCKELLRYRILKESELKFGREENYSESTSSIKIKTSNGLFTAPKGISVSTCPALQVIAHNTFVNNVKMDAIREVEAFSPMERALDAFKGEWKELGRRLSIGTARIYSVPLMPGLCHIGNLFCFADNSKRTENKILANNDKESWKNFYLAPCRKLKGSIVMGLYPDFYKKDKGSGVAIPFYSENNIKGAVDAAVELLSRQRSDGCEPISFMFAETDVALAKAISEEIKNRKIEPMSSMESEPQDGIYRRAQEHEVATSRKRSELSPVNEKTEETKNHCNVSSERKFVLGQLQLAKNKMMKASAQKKLQDISTKLFNLSEEELTTVLGSLDQNILNASFKRVSLTAPYQTTIPEPSRPICPDDLPTPKKEELKLRVRRAMVMPKEKFEMGSTSLIALDIVSDE